MTTAPTTKFGVRAVPMKRTERAVAKTTATPVARPLTTLSACLTMAATRRPPPAWRATRVQAMESKPERKETGGSEETEEGEEEKRFWTKERVTEMPASWTLRIQREVVEPFG